MLIPFLFVGSAAAIAVGWFLFIAMSEPLKPQHQKIYDSAVKCLTDPVKLTNLAGAFAKMKYPKHAKALVKLAAMHKNKPGKPRDPGCGKPPLDAFGPTGDTEKENATSPTDATNDAVVQAAIAATGISDPTAAVSASQALDAARAAAAAALGGTVLTPAQAAQQDAAAAARAAANKAIGVTTDPQAIANAAIAAARAAAAKAVGGTMHGELADDDPALVAQVQLVDEVPLTPIMNPITIGCDPPKVGVEK
jgi:hypothetical protein